ncbi:low temperature requirement protein A [Micromonospora lupini]|uniref:low temperature requirement protein A n=1 Tax=Micromonospora lupini TaxID=285679 RepID=UPI00224F9B74|nr:low temperature requirement protein A [Micromonospora lupini]MCX5065003.1 low temperature requirement protein A [Micromonospora lupini]
MTGPGPDGGPVHPQLLRPRRGVERTTSTELFFDLVYVFTITQLSHYLSEDLSWRGAGRTAVLLGLVWLVWIYTVWMGNWLHPDRAPVRATLLVVTLGSLLLAAALPTAFGDDGLLFAGAYAAVQVGRTLFVLWAIRGQPWLGDSFRQCVVWISGTGALAVVGGLVDSPVRELIWIGVIVVDAVGLATGFPVPGMGRSKPEHWRVEGGHLAERCQAFILIALGESILITGGTLTQRLDRVTIGAFLLAFAGSVALWWVYFDRAQAGTAVLAGAGERAGGLSRLLFNYLHPVMVAGIVVTAVGDERLLHAPGESVDRASALVVLGGPALFLAGHAAYQMVLGYAGVTARVAAALLLLALSPAAVAVRVPVAVAAGGALLITVAVIAADWVSGRRAPSRGPQSRGPRSPLR